MRSEQLFDLADSINIVDVIGHYIPLKHDGSHYLGLCPFHNDHKYGSFKVTPGKRKYKCFACGEYGSGIDFVSKYTGCSLRDAAIEICETHNLVSHSEAETFRTGEYVARQIAPTVLMRPKRQLAERANPLHLEAVYRAFYNAAGGSEKLMKRYKEHLIKVRNLEANELSDYFTFPSPTNHSFWVRFHQELSKYLGETNVEKLDEALLGVPGFFKDKEGHITFIPLSYPSLGMLIRDRERHITGIQLRAMCEIKPGQSRYRMMSSGFADGTAGSGSMGCGAGFVEDVLCPTVKWHHSIAITEGRFKAVALSKLGFIVVNMQSIANWRPASNIAIDLAKEHDSTRRFVLAYDQEEKNRNVFLSMNHMQNALKQACLPIEVAVWNGEYGKGIDDIINNVGVKAISRVPIEQYLGEKNFFC